MAARGCVCLRFLFAGFEVILLLFFASGTARCAIHVAVINAGLFIKSSADQYDREPHYNDRDASVSDKIFNHKSAPS